MMARLTKRKGVTHCKHRRNVQSPIKKKHLELFYQNPQVTTFCSGPPPVIKAAFCVSVIISQLKVFKNLFPHLSILKMMKMGVYFFPALGKILCRLDLLISILGVHHLPQMVPSFLHNITANGKKNSSHLNPQMQIP